MRQATLGAKPQYVMVQVKNADTVTIPAGSAVVLAFNGTDDGLAVVLPVTAAANLQQSLPIGIASQSIAVSSVGDVHAFGMVLDANVLLATRSASTVAWPSWGAIAVGDVLIVESVNNGLQRFAAGSATTFVSTVNYTAPNYDLPVAGKVIASGTTQASSYTATAYTYKLGQSTVTQNLASAVSALYVQMPVFVRFM